MTTPDTRPAKSGSPPATLPPAGFNLSTLVREILDNSPDADPTTLAAQVITAIPRKDRNAAMVQAMRPYVRQFITASRAGLPPATPIDPNQPNRWRQHAIREGWQRVLAQREWVPGDGWKFFRDLTAVEVRLMAAHRDEVASRNATQARSLRSLATAMEELDAATVVDLPADVLAEHLGRAA